MPWPRLGLPGVSIRSTMATRPDRPLEGQVALITGAARGIGFATARRLAEDGASVALFDRDADAVEEAGGKLQAEGLRTGWRAVDVTDEHAVRNGVMAVISARGRIDILVNNAGIYPHTAFADLTF